MLFVLCTNGAKVMRESGLWYLTASLLVAMYACYAPIVLKKRLSLKNVLGEVAKTINFINS